MSVDREYKIRIDLTSQTAGASDAARELDKVGVAAKEAEGPLERLGISHHALHQILHLIGASSGPEAEAALAGMAAVGGGGIMVLLLGIKELVEWIKKLKEESDAAKIQLIDMGIAAREAAQDAEDSWNKYLEKLNAVKDPVQVLEQSYNRQKASLAELLKEHEKILEAMEQEELAAAKGDKTKEEQIRSRYEQTKSVSEAAGSQAELQAHQQYLDQLKQRQGGLNSAAAVAAADVEYLKGNKFYTPGFKPDEAQEAQLKYAADKAEAFINSSVYRQTAGGILGLGRPATREEIMQGNQEGKILPNSQYEDIRAYARYETNRQAYEEYNKQLEAEQKILEKNEEARQKNKDAIDKESDAINTEWDKRNATISGGALTQAIALSRRAAVGGSLSASESQFVQGLGTMITGQNVSLQTSEQMFQLAASKASVMDSFLKRILTVLEAMPNMSSFEQRLAALETRTSRPTQ